MATGRPMPYQSERDRAGDEGEESRGSGAW